MLENPIKGGNAGKTGIQCNLGNGIVRILQQGFGSFDPADAEIIAEIIVGVFLEKSGKMEFTEAHLVCQIIQRNILHVICINIFQGSVEALYVFVLLAGAVLGEQIFFPASVFSQFYKEI